MDTLRALSTSRIQAKPGKFPFLDVSIALAQCWPYTDDHQLFTFDKKIYIYITLAIISNGLLNNAWVNILYPFVQITIKTWSTLVHQVALNLSRQII